jgi:hypothetical protein
MDRLVHDDKRRVITIKTFHRLLLAGAVALGVVLPALPAGAATAQTVTPTLTCDGAARTVSAAIAGSGYAANTRLTVSALFQSGAWDLADQSVQPHRSLIQSRPATTVTVNTDATGAFAAPLFTSPFVTTGTVANYTETWGFKVTDPNGTQLWLQYVKCRYDTRTVSHFDCDGDGHGYVSASGSGLNSATEPTVLVTYYWDEVVTQYRGEPAFRTKADQLNLPVARQVTVAVNADGTWSDTGLQKQSTDPDLVYDWVHYQIAIGRNGIVGGAEGSCLLVDRRTS